MTEWWNSLSLLYKIFFCMAVPATVIMVIQTILLLIGIGSGSDADGADGEVGDGVDGEVGDDIDGDFSDSADAGDIEDFSDTDGVPDDIDDASAETGSDAYGPTNGGSDGGLKLFTVRTVVAFFAVGGWTGTAMIAAEMSEAVTIPAAFLAGTAAVFAIALLFKYSLRLQDNGMVLIQNTLGKTADVYLFIPEKRKGKGKVTVLVQERFREYDAVTDNAYPIKTGEKAIITGIADEQTVIVKPIRRTE